MLHQDEGGIGNWEISHHQSFYREWIRKTFPVDREGLTVLKSILPCWWWKNAVSCKRRSPIPYTTFLNTCNAMKAVRFLVVQLNSEPGSPKPKIQCFASTESGDSSLSDLGQPFPFLATVLCKLIWAQKTHKSWSPTLTCLSWLCFNLVGQSSGNLMRRRSDEGSEAGIWNLSYEGGVQVCLLSQEAYTLHRRSRGHSTKFVNI